jgi:hypothetical protein
MLVQIMLTCHTAIRKWELELETSSSGKFWAAARAMQCDPRPGGPSAPAADRDYRDVRTILPVFVKRVRIPDVIMTR